MDSQPCNAPMRRAPGRQSGAGDGTQPQLTLRSRAGRRLPLTTHPRPTGSVRAVTDSSTLLSTCAGAGATLVAIIGGLLVSRYLTLESEALSAKKVVGSLEDKLQDARVRAQESRYNHEVFALREALTEDDRLVAFFGAVPDGGLHADVVVADLGWDGVSPETLDGVVALFNSEAARVAKFDWDLVPYAENHDSWEDFAKQHGVRSEVDEMWEFYYIEVCKERPAVYQAGNITIPMLDTATLGIVSVAEQNRRRDVRNRLIDARDLDRAEVRRLEVELAGAVTARESLEQPPGLVVGLLVLAFLTITSVIVPVLLLVPTPASLTYRQGVGVVGLFVAGIVVLFAYLGSHVYRLLRLSREVPVAPNQ